ncbi:hypothetical protein FPQ18DRAFT_411758 [Pyronema domesticum]|nr:hypothetical protein FPQ18DRAFT_411758 [Pyronema domesticum]
MGQAVMQRSASQTERYYILIGNLAWKIRWQDLKDLTRQYSRAVEHAQIYLTPDGRSRGMGWVRIKGREEALKVFDKLNGIEWEGRALILKLGNEHDICPIGDQSIKTPPQTAHKSLHTSPRDTQQERSHQTLSTQAEYYPHVLEGMMYGYPPSPPSPYYCNTNSYGYAFPSPPAAEMGFLYPPMMYPVYTDFQYPLPSPPISENDSPIPFTVHPVQPTTWIDPDTFNVMSVPALVETAPKPTSKTEPRSIHVRNLPYDLTWKELKEHVEPAGKVLRCDVPKGTNGKGKGYGTILFQKQSDADRCLELFNGSSLKGRVMWLRRDKFASRRDTLAH